MPSHISQGENIMISTNSFFEIGNNKILGHYPEVQNSTIKFTGSNNILYCEENVKLVDSEIKFAGDNSVVYLSSNRNPYKLSVLVHNDNVLHIGKDNYINKSLLIILSERKHCYIGDNCMFSINIMIKTADGHLIYDCLTGNRINPSESIYIGDHVWVGQDTRILKGTQIDSGCTIGAMSLMAGTKIPHNTTYAGNPCHLIHNNTFWDRANVHNWSTSETESSMNYNIFNSHRTSEDISFHDDFWIYNYNPSETIEWNELDTVLSSPNLLPLQKLEYLIQLNTNKSKNRFVHKW